MSCLCKLFCLFKSKIVNLMYYLLNHQCDHFLQGKEWNTTDPLCSKQFLIVLPTLSRNTTDTSAVKNQINSFHENGLEKGLKFCLTKYGCVLNYQTYIA